MHFLVTSLCVGSDDLTCSTKVKICRDVVGPGRQPGTFFRGQWKPCIFVLISIYFLRIFYFT